MPATTWQKSSYCAQGEACLHVAATWQKSSHCQEGEACLHVAVSGVAETVHLTESGDPAHSILSTTPAAFDALLRALKRNNHG
ncbi:DUF397 domain-containing protein [Streptomyces sp. NBC_00151]|uniref:DUF397 domain-containing protein n=1 Tax=Streptomyces sp. NBC_00151 TaxID=2975669 RepID=UPI002DD939E5|nr:DUF397 domain-containing protein [Streptomyces sp. NBC_00151]WRZ41176.1 DUF397 domain-containing protein [Streptomyces sp. NBC_00151]